MELVGKQDYLLLPIKRLLQVTNETRREGLDIDED